MSEVLFTFQIDRFLTLGTNLWIHLLFAVVYICLIVSYLIKWTDKNATYNLLEDVSGPVHKVNLYYPVGVIMIESFLFHVLYIGSNFGQEMTTRMIINVSRHLDALIYKSMIILCVAVICKITYLFTVMAVVTLAACFTLFQWEQDTKLLQPEIGVKSFFMSYLPYSMLWVIIIKSFYNKINVTEDEVEDFAMYVVWITFGFMTMNGIVQLWYVVSLPKTFKITNKHLQLYDGSGIWLALIEKMVFIGLMVNGFNNK